MTVTHSIIPLLAVLVSAVGALLIIATGSKRANLREFWSVAAGVVKFGLAASMIPAVLSGKTLGLTLFRFLPGVEIAFRVDGFGLLFGCGAALLWIATSFYSIGYMRSLEEHAQTRYFACFSIALSTTMGVAFAANLFTMFIFYEGLTICTYPLVSHKETPEAKAGGRKYVIYLLGAAKLLLVGAIIMTYNAAGTLAFAKGGILPAAVLAARPWLYFAVFAMFLYGFAKCAVMPMHSWLPAAMVAPTPVSALLHAVAVVKTGVFCVLRVMLFIYGAHAMHAVGADKLALTAAVITILAASFIALTRDNIKARLAFSTIGQLSYIILGGALLNTMGTTGGIAHITIHGFTKITLFFCAGSIYVSAHKTEVSQISGLAKRMPWTMGAFAVATMGLVGIPPAGGFVSKWHLAIGAVQNGQPWLMAVLLASSFLSAGYLGPILYKAYFEPEPEPADGHAHEIREVPWMIVPIVFCAAGSFLLGVFPDLMLHLARLGAP